MGVILQIFPFEILPNRWYTAFLQHFPLCQMSGGSPGKRLENLRAFVYRTNSNIVMLDRQKEPIPGSSVGVTNI